MFALHMPFKENPLQFFAVLRANTREELIAIVDQESSEEKVETNGQQFRTWKPGSKLGVFLHFDAIAYMTDGQFDGIRAIPTEEEFVNAAVERARAGATAHYAQFATIPSSLDDLPEADADGGEGCCGNCDTCEKQEEPAADTQQEG